MKGVVNYGLMVLNDYDDGSPDDRRYQSTVIVTGVARGGTSMVAQVLDRLGLFLGDTCDPVVFEDVEILRALQASDISKLAGIIANRNQRFPRWGFKVPNLHHLLPATETSRFRNARFVVVFRDPLAIARRNELSMHQSAAEALREAGENVAELTTYVAGIAAPVLLISYEKALWHADHMIDAICTFCGLTPINEQKAAALAAITPSGEAYIYSTQLVVLGQIDNICGTTLRGWCCFSGLTDAVEIEVIADGRPIGVHLAQDYRKDLLDAGIGLGCHAFHVDLTEVDIHPSTMISVRPSGRTVVLPNSGKSVDELRQHGRKITAVKIRLIMMLKNEGDLALSWITYHGSIVGYEKLIILDNGSTCDRTLSALKQGMAAGATVDYQYAAKADFTRRDQIYAALVQRMDSEDPADFYIALDCDEFLSVVRNGRVDCSSDALEEELSSYVNCPNPLVIHSRLDNDPHRPGFFRWSPNQRKVFFAKDGCESLDQALHIERSRVGPDPIRTKLVCITYRNKPYDLSIEHLKASLAPSGADFRSESVRDYVDEKEDAGHCPARVPGSEKEYARGFNDQAFIEFPEIGKKFEWFGENLPFSSNGAKT